MGDKHSTISIAQRCIGIRHLLRTSIGRVHASLNIIRRDVGM